jgi:hypothetical protein
VTASSNKWALPEFGLLTHVHNPVQKKLKVNFVPTVNPKDLQKYQQDFDKGFEKGYSEGLEKGKQEIKKQMDVLAALMIEVTNFKMSFSKKFEEEGVQVLKSVCEHLLNHELSISNERINEILSKAINVIDDRVSGIKIYCNEALIMQIQSDISDYRQKNISFERDPSLVDYNFRIESNKQLLEFDMKKSLNNLFAENPL